MSGPWQKCSDKVRTRNMSNASKCSNMAMVKGGGGILTFFGCVGATPNICFKYMKMDGLGTTKGEWLHLQVRIASYKIINQNLSIYMA